VRREAILLLAAGLGACSSSGNAPTKSADASTDANASPPADAAPPPADAGVDATATQPVDAGSDATDAGEAADAAPEDASADAFVCTWDGPYESPACSACLVANCCFTTEECEDDPDCVALDTCVDDCLETEGGDAGVSTCAQDCDNAEPQSARDEWHAWNACIESQCGANGGAGPCY
jgi:hypothetical protein